MTVLLAKVVGPEVRVNAVAPGTGRHAVDRGLGRRARGGAAGGPAASARASPRTWPRSSWPWPGPPTSPARSWSSTAASPSPPEAPVPTGAERPAQRAGATAQRTAAARPVMSGVTAAVSSSRSSGPATERPSSRRAQPGRTPIAAASTSDVDGPLVRAAVATPRSSQSRACLRLRPGVELGPDPQRGSPRTSSAERGTHVGPEGHAPPGPPRRSTGRTAPGVSGRRRRSGWDEARKLDISATWMKVTSSGSSAE